MVQLIGFLLCVYMVVRGLDIASRIEDRRSRRSAGLASAAAALAIIGALVFFVLLIDQGQSAGELTTPAVS